MNNDLKQAKEILKNENLCIVAVRNGKTVLKSSEKGVKALVGALRKDPTALFGSSAADKVVGKAAALLMVKGNISRVFTPVISQGAFDFLERNGVNVKFGCKTGHIMRQDKSGICPMEQRCMEIEDPEEGFGILKEWPDRK